jgi:hypothetical protein
MLKFDHHEAAFRGILPDLVTSHPAPATIEYALVNTQEKCLRCDQIKDILPVGQHTLRLDRAGGRPVAANEPAISERLVVDGETGSVAQARFGIRPYLDSRVGTSMGTWQWQPGHMTLLLSFYTRVTRRDSRMHGGL